MTAIATGVVALGIVVAGIQLMDSRRGRNGEVAQNLARRWDSAEMVKARRLIIRLTAGKDATKAVKDLADAVSKSKTTPGDNDYYTFVRYLNFFEEIGVLWRFGSVSVKMVETILGTTIRTNWRLCGPVTQAVWGSATKGCENFARIAAKLERRAEWRLVAQTLKEIFLLRPAS